MQKFYLLTVLIEHSSDCISDIHSLYDNLWTIYPKTVNTLDWNIYTIPISNYC